MIFNDCLKKGCSETPSFRGYICTSYLSFIPIQAEYLWNSLAEGCIYIYIYINWYVLIVKQQRGFQNKPEIAVSCQWDMGSIPFAELACD